MYKIVGKSSEHATPKYVTLAYLLFSAKGTWKIADTERCFLASLLFLKICHKISHEKGGLPLQKEKKRSYHKTGSGCWNGFVLK